jgi:hypothetical protein
MIHMRDMLDDIDARRLQSSGLWEPHDLNDQAVRDGVKHRFASLKGAPSDWKSDRPGCVKPWLNVRTEEDELAIAMPSLSPNPGQLVSLATRWDELNTNVQASGQLLLPL